MILRTERCLFNNKNEIFKKGDILTICTEKIKEDGLIDEKEHEGKVTSISDYNITLDCSRKYDKDVWIIPYDIITDIYKSNR